MINIEIVNRLSLITNEEKEIIRGKKHINLGLYMLEGENIISNKKLLEEGKLIAIRPHTRFIDFPEHTHDFIEVVYMCKGKTLHTINGAKIILNEGELLFIGKGAKQQISRCNEDDIAVNFIILPQFFDTTLSMLGDEDTLIKKFILNSLNNEENHGGYLHFKISDVLPIQNLIENLLFTLIHNTPNKRKINQTTMGLLILNLLNHTDKISYDNELDAFTLEIYRYIEENYRDGSLTSMAKELHCDFYWLSRQIKKLTGKTYTELIQEKRLSKAAFLLKNTSLNVLSIASSVGYENISYFHRLFFSKYNCSPKKYRTCK